MRSKASVTTAVTTLTWLIVTLAIDGATTLTFTCPAARDTIEIGGLYSLYTAPVVNGDAAAAVVCR